MTTAAIVLAFALSCVTVGTAAGWIVAAASLRFVDRLRWAGRSRAIFLAQLRLLPLAASVLLVVVQVLAFVRFEESRNESTGPLLLLLSGIGAVLVVNAIYGGVRCLRRTAALGAAWQKRAIPLRRADWPEPVWVIRPSAPVVVVLGAIRPRLFVAFRVLRFCTAQEMAAIMAHEAAHVQARDPLVGLLFAVTPGAGFLPRLAKRLESHWRAAAEEAADQRAAETVGSVELASALTRIARMMPPDSSGLLAAELIGKADIATRVRRLLDGSFTPKSHGAWLPAALLLLLALIAQFPVAAARLHGLFESLTRPY
jgi:hypothetical protein